MTNDRSGMIRTNPDAGHSRIAIGVGKINISTGKNVLIVRAARRKNERGEN
jgi:hypothetical protein